MSYRVIASCAVVALAGLACASDALGAFVSGGQSRDNSFQRQIDRGERVSPFLNTIDAFAVTKTGCFVQVGPGTVGTQSFNFLAGFTERNPADHLVQVGDFRYENLDSIPNSVGISEFAPGEWAWDDPTMFGNESAMNHTYTSDNDYTFAVTVDGLGVFEEMLDGPSDLYPDTVPEVGNYAALQSGLDPTAAIDVFFDGFGAPAGADQLRVIMSVLDGGGSVWSGVGANTDTSMTIPANTLDPSKNYEIVLMYEASKHESAVGVHFPDANAAWTFAYKTEAPMVTGLPAPGTMGMVGIIGLGFTRRRRR